MPSKKAAAMGQSNDHERLCRNLRQAFPIADAGGFAPLLDAIDRADAAAAHRRGHSDPL